MTALADALILYNLHRIRYSIGEHISGFYHVAHLYSDRAGHRRVHSSRTHCYIVPSLRCLANLSYTPVNSCQYSTPWKYFRSKEHALYRIKACRLVLTLWVYIFSPSHTAAVLRVLKDLIINKLEQMIRVINFNVYSRTVAYKLFLCNIGLFRNSVYLCKRYSNNTRGSYGKHLRGVIVLCISEELVLSSTYHITLLACSLFFHKELVHRLDTVSECTSNFYRSPIALCITAPDSITSLYILYILRLSIWKCY